MSVVVRDDATGIVHVVAKGAETAILPKGEAINDVLTEGGVHSCHRRRRREGGCFNLQGGAGGLKHGMVEADLDVADIGKQWNAVNPTKFRTTCIDLMDKRKAGSPKVPKIFADVIY